MRGAKARPGDSSAPSVPGALRGRAERRGPGTGRIAGAVRARAKALRRVARPPAVRDWRVWVVAALADACGTGARRGDQYSMDVFRRRWCHGAVSIGRLHDDEVSVDAELIRELLDTQFPHWAGL